MSAQATRRILHLDMDAFFASVEQRDNPELVALPVLVGGRGPRSVVAACSYEARPYGIHSAMPMRRALDLCPDAVCVSPRMNRYRTISESIFEYLHEQAPRVEKTSIDEAYLDISDVVSSDREARDLGTRMKEEILECYELRCSVGIGPNKMVAKIASDLKKPDALVLVPTEEVEAFLAPLPVSRITGVGKVGRGKLEEMGVQTIQQLRRLSRDELSGLFGKWGFQLYDYARGVDERQVITTRTRKSISREHTFEEDQRKTAPLMEKLGEEAEQLAHFLEGRNWLAHTVHLKLRYSDFRLINRQVSYDKGTDKAQELVETAAELLQTTEAGKRPVRLVGLGVSSFSDKDAEWELPLFPQETAKNA